MLLKVGGRLHLKLNIGETPIANKYREGKMKSTLERELKVREIVEREALEVSHAAQDSAWLLLGVFLGSKPALVCVVGEAYGECGILGCVIALCRIRRRRPRNAVCPLGGSSDTFTLRMLA